MRYFPFFLFLFFFACENTTEPDVPVSNKEDKTYEIEIDLSDNPELIYKKLQIFPVLANQSFIEAHQFAAKFKNLKEGIDIKGFRITEKKPYGRFSDEGAVNTLTVQNKSQDTIYIMSGDIVKGGQQDRMLAQDMVVPPRTIRDIAVYCVEQGRWNYQDESGNEIDQQLAIQNRKINAFTAYYNVASNDLRKTMKSTQNQKAVWKKVGELTALHNAVSSTGAYSSLENADDFTRIRNEYQDYFTGKMENLENVVGMMVISGDELIGADVFSHPNLFKKQYEVLLHSYIIDAISNGAEVSISPEALKSKVEKIKFTFSNKLGQQEEKEAKFKYNGKLVHFTQL